MCPVKNTPVCSRQASFPIQIIETGSPNSDINLSFSDMRRLLERAPGIRLA